MAFNAAEWKPKRTIEECNAILESAESPFQTEEVEIEGRGKMRVYKSLPPTLRAIWLSTKAFAHQDYIVYEGERYTYGKVHEEVAKIVVLLQSQGVSRGSKVALAMRNLPEWIMIWWAAHMLGAIVVGVNALNPFDALKHCILLTEPTVLFVDPERAAVLAPILKKIKRGGCHAVYVVRAHKILPGYLGFENAVGRIVQTEYPAESELLPEDGATIFFTSGTTSLPKGVFATQRQVLTNLFSTSIGAVRACLRRGEGIPQPIPDQSQRSLLLVVPLFHVTGTHSYLMSLTAVGGKIILMHKWNLPKAIASIRKEKVTVTGGVPFILLEVLDALKGSDDHFLETLSFGGAAPPLRLTDDVQATKKGMVMLTQAYGLTESNAVAVSHAAEDYLARPASCGVVAPVTKMKIIDPETEKELPTGESGEICLYGINICTGYYKDKKATKAAFTKDGWFKSGDIGYISEEKFLYISDRLKEMIIVKGENVSTVSVESVLFDHPAAKELAVVPVPDEQAGELVAATIVLKPGCSPRPTEADFKAWAAAKLPRHCVPVMVWIQETDLPRNASGKILKKDVRVKVVERYLALKAQSQLQAKL